MNTFAESFDLFVLRCQHNLKSQNPDHRINRLEDGQNQQSQHSVNIEGGSSMHQISWQQNANT